jgi:class 3 adenylate cyclase
VFQAIHYAILKEPNENVVCQLGQTVNVAQLMESKSGGNCILVSESTRWRLRDYFTFETVPDVQTKSGHAVHAYRLVLDRSRDPYD